MLVSIPGIADTTAAALLAEIVDVHQFSGARQVAAFAGLVPKIRQSGSSVRGRACLSKACLSKQSRRVATRYDKIKASYQAFVTLASIRFWLR